MKNPLQLFVCYIHPVTQQHESRTIGKARLYQSSYYEIVDSAVRPSYRLKLEYPFRFSVSYVQLFESRTV